MAQSNMKPEYRAIFISDLHLGFHGARAREVSQLLKHVRCEQLYLVGDIIDMWRLKQRWYWPTEHNDVVRRILKHAKHGTEVVYIPGNHDESARQYVRLEFGGVKVLPQTVHKTADGRRLLVTHGDQYDLVVKHSRLLSMLGGAAYDWLVKLNVYYNKLRALCGLKYWSLSQFIKLKVKSACKFISRFEEALVDESRRRKLDGVVCGHIHKAERRMFGEIEYINCGDWVESCTFVVEHFDGRLEVLDGLAVLSTMKAEKTVDDDLPKLENTQRVWQQLDMSPVER